MDHQPVKNLEGVSTKVNPVQRWFDFLSTYTYTLAYLPETANSIAGLTPSCHCRYLPMAIMLS